MTHDSWHPDDQKNPERPDLAAAASKAVELDRAILEVGRAASDVAAFESPAMAVLQREFAAYAAAEKAGMRVGSSSSSERLQAAAAAAERPCIPLTLTGKSEQALSALYSAERPAALGETVLSEQLETIRKANEQCCAAIATTMADGTIKVSEQIRLAVTKAELTRLASEPVPSPLSDWAKEAFEPQGVAYRNSELLFGPASILAENILGNSEAMHRIASSTSAFRALTESLRQTRLDAALMPFGGSFQETREAMGSLGARFGEYSSVFRMCAGVQSAVDALDAVTRQAEAMRLSWMDPLDPARSVRGLAGLTAIGVGLRDLPPFSEEMSGLLRDSIGDWRDVDLDYPIPRPTPEVYRERGFRQELVDFGDDCFDELLELALSLMPSKEKREGLKRSAKAQHWFLSLEASLRHFIDREMTAAVGPNWAKHRVPGELRRSWQDLHEKKTGKRVSTGELLDSSYLVQLIQVIEANNNWTEVFSCWFGRKEDIRESLVRLGPLRNDVMHSRPIGHMDYAVVVVESRRILNAIGVSLP